jgi:hypothetical protein
MNKTLINHVRDTKKPHHQTIQINGAEYIMDPSGRKLVRKDATGIQQCYNGMRIIETEWQSISRGSKDKDTQKG